MAYSTQTDILHQLDERTLIQLTDDEGLGEIDTTVLARAIADADATIDAYLQGRYEVPLSSVPAKIRQISVDLALYHLFSRKDDTAPETRRGRYQDALRFLEQVASGRIRLGAPTLAAETTPDAADLEASDRLFKRDRMKGF